MESRWGQSRSEHAGRAAGPRGARGNGQGRSGRGGAPVISFHEASSSIDVTVAGFQQTVRMGGTWPLFRLEVETPGAGPASVLTPQDFRLVDSKLQDSRILLRYEMHLPASSGAVGADITLTQTGNEVAGTLLLRCSGNLVVRQAWFPCVHEEAVLPFDSLLVSAPWGDNIRNPVRTIRQYCAARGSSWIYGYVDAAKDEVSYVYPSILAMQYVVLHNPSRALSVASYSTGDSTLAFNAAVLDEAALGLSISHYPFLRDGTWTSPECGVSLLQGDWHAAADAYAARMRGVFRALLRCEAREDAARVLALDLHPEFAVDSVAWEDGRPLRFFRAKDARTLWVECDRALSAGEPPPRKSTSTRR